MKDCAAAVSTCLIWAAVDKLEGPATSTVQIIMAVLSSVHSFNRLGLLCCQPSQRLEIKASDTYCLGNVTQCRDFSQPAAILEYLTQSHQAAYWLETTGDHRASTLNVTPLLHVLNGLQLFRRRHCRSCRH